MPHVKTYIFSPWCICGYRPSEDEEILAIIEPYNNTLLVTWSLDITRHRAIQPFT